MRMAKKRKNVYNAIFLAITGECWKPRSCFQWAVSIFYLCSETVNRYLPHATFSHAQSLQKYRRHAFHDSRLLFELRLHNKSFIHATCFICASRYTEHQHKLSPTNFSCVAVVLRTQTCCLRNHFSTEDLAGWYLLRYSTSQQVLSPERSRSTGFWSIHKIE